MQIQGYLKNIKPEISPMIDLPKRNLFENYFVIFSLFKTDETQQVVTF